ncbi:MAG: hybrid sensor histidine kinase/response regulator [Deltaproteobacteria bacterium]|nr:hybrid sensor histidine kinase/response regulator [Deltaproteobacteria bacterium]
MNIVSGAAMLCADDGSIRRCFVGDCGFFRPGAKLWDLVTQGYRDKAKAFWRAVFDGTQTTPWDLELDIGNEVQIRSCMGGRTDEGVLVLISGSFGELFGFYEELIRINSELTNELRKAHRDMALMARQQERESEDILEELALVNNELTNAQRTLAKKNEELARLNAQKSAFLGMAAHDLRNPLGAILNFASIIRADMGPEAAEPATMLERIEVLSRTSLRMVDDFLDATVLESGRLDLKTEPLDLVAGTRAGLVLHRLSASKKSMELDLVVREERIPVLADEEKLSQVLDNLLSNAIKYSPKGSKIRVEVQVDGPWGMVAVEDQGPGIPEKDRDAVFDLFVKSTSKTTGGEKSSGIGLAIVKRIVDAHGGNIRVDGGADGGARFVVRLPLAREEDSPKIRGDASSDRTFSGGADFLGPILVVDDDRMQQEVLKALFSRRKTDCRAVGSVDEAFKELDRGGYLAVVTDLDLGDASGLDLLARMRNRPDLARIPAFVLTGDADARTRERCLSAGAWEVFVKPVGATELERIGRLSKGSEDGGT